MYKLVEKGQPPIIEENLFYKSKTTRIYKDGDFLYKIYLKKEPHKREILDYLIEHYDELKLFSVPPLQKLKIENNYGMKMRFVEGTDFFTYFKEDSKSPEEMIRIMKILSDNLRQINKLELHFSDLHQKNILIRKQDLYPIYIDLDDASLKQCGSTHICAMAHKLHNVKNKSYEYEDDLIKYGNLDQEILTLLVLNYIMNKPMEELTYDEFNKEVEKISSYFPNDFISTILAIKNKEDSTIVTPYDYYIGDYIQGDNFIESIQKVKRRQKCEDSNI